MLALVVGDDHVSGSQGVGVGLKGVLLVVHELVVDVGAGQLQHVAHGVQRTVAPGGQVVDFVVDGQGHVSHRGALLPDPGDILDGNGQVLVLVLMGEGQQDVLGGELLVGPVGDVLDVVAHLLGHFLGQVVAEVVLQDVGDAALAGLAVDADDVGLVLPVHVLGVQGQVGDGPVGFVPLLPELHALGDGVLVGAGEGGEDQLAGVGLAVAHVHAGELFIELHDVGHVGEVQLGVHTVGEEVHGHGDDVHVAGALAVAEEGALNAVAPCQQGQLAGGYAGAPVVVGMDGDDDVFPAVQVLAHVLDLLGVDVGHGHLHGGGQVDDDLALGAGLPHVDDGVADAQGELDLRAGETLGGVLKAEVGLGHLLGVLVESLSAFHGDVHDLVLAHAEDLLTLGEGGGVVQVDHHVLGPLDGVEGLFDNVGAGLGQDLDVHIVGDPVLLDDGAQELILRLGSGGEAHLDLLEAKLQQEVEEGELLLQVHGGDEGLVAVPQVHAAPGGGLGDALFLCPVHASLRGHVVPGTVFGIIFHIGVTVLSVLLYSIRKLRRGDKKSSVCLDPSNIQRDEDMRFSAVPLLLASDNAHSNSPHSGVRRQLAPYGLAPDSRSLGWKRKRLIPFIACRYKISTSLKNSGRVTVCQC